MEALRDNGMVATPAGLEPATPCLEGRCSIRLSYGATDQWVQASSLLKAKLSAYALGFGAVDRGSLTS